MSDNEKKDQSWWTAQRPDAERWIVKNSLYVTILVVAVVLFGGAALLLDSVNVGAIVQGVALLGVLVLIGQKLRGRL